MEPMGTVPGGSLLRTSGSGSSILLPFKTLPYTTQPHIVYDIHMKTWPPLNPKPSNGGRGISRGSRIP